MKPKGKKSVNTIQETSNHKVLLQLLHHLSFIFGYSVYTALYGRLSQSSHGNNYDVMIIHMKTNSCPPTTSVDYVVYPLRFLSMCLLQQVSFTE